MNEQLLEIAQTTAIIWVLCQLWVYHETGMTQLIGKIGCIACPVLLIVYALLQQVTYVG